MTNCQIQQKWTSTLLICPPSRFGGSCTDWPTHSRTRNSAPPRMWYCGSELKTYKTEFVPKHKKHKHAAWYHRFCRVICNNFWCTAAKSQGSDGGTSFWGLGQGNQILCKCHFRFTLYPLTIENTRHWELVARDNLAKNPWQKHGNVRGKMTHSVTMTNLWRG